MGSVKILSKREAQRMREVGELAAATLCHVGRQLEAGMTTEDINTIVHEYTLAAGARPAPLNYKGFPKSVCTSVNHVVCHGIPGPQKLRDGDIINVDVTSVLPAVNGWFGDTSATFYIGEPSALTKHVVEVARECLELGIAVVKPGARIGDIGHAIQTYAEAKGCSVVRTYTGHGIHRIFHDSPSVPHYGRPGTGTLIRKGMCFTIEPMINLGHWAVDHLDDDWTVVTQDGSLSAQFEHTLLVTARGCEVLTRRNEVLQNSEDKAWSRVGKLSGFVPES
jgi:methionyl aminopeptidase